MNHIFKHIIITETDEIFSCPFITHIRSNLREIDFDTLYFIHKAELAIEYFDDIDYLNNKINDNVYWFETNEELNHIILNIIKERCIQAEIIIDYSKIIEYKDYIFYYKSKIGYNVLIENKVYHLDLNILNHLYQTNNKIEDIFQKDKLIDYEKLKVKFKEAGFLYDNHIEEKYLLFLNNINCTDYLLFFYKWLWDYKTDIVYNIDNKFNNPYENILHVENYLNNISYNNIDLKKCKEYNLKFDTLPATYVYSGFHTTTGRIYCTSSDFSPLQNLPANKRDILYAEKDCFLIEFDYKSFEFDILCQIINYPIEKDPHTEIFDKLIGLDIPNKRDIGKSINYSYLYGMSENRLADSILNKIPELSTSFKEEFINKMREEPMFIKVKEFEKTLKKEIKDESIINYFGRRILYKKEYAVLNNYISSTAADFLYNKFILIIELLKQKGLYASNKILLQNHDSILIQLKKQTVEETDLFENILLILNRSVSGLSGRIEYKYGANWKEMM